MAKNMLIADDLLNSTSFSQDRSHLLHNFSADLAEKLNSQARLIYVKDPGAKKVQLLDENQTREQVAEIFARKKVRLQFIPKVGNPVEEILKSSTTLSPKPSLVIMGTHGKTGLDRFFLGSVAEEVIRHSSTPVLILGPQFREAKVKTGGKILVATDLTKNSHRAEAYAMKLALALNAEVVFINSIFETVRTADQYAAISGTAFIDDSFLNALRKQSGQALKQKVQLFKAKRIKASFVLDDKGPTSSQALTKEAQNGYQFLVMGTHGRNSFLSAVLGSTSRQTLITTTVSTIIVRSTL